MQLTRAGWDKIPNLPKNLCAKLSLVVCLFVIPFCFYLLTLPCSQLETIKTFRHQKQRSPKDIKEANSIVGSNPWISQANENWSMASKWGWMCLIFLTQSSVYCIADWVSQLESDDWWATATLKASATKTNTSQRFPNCDVSEALLRWFHMLGYSGCSTKIGGFESFGNM